ncbi:unnamed protein product, partial [marine sediment metagenome]
MSYLMTSKLSWRGGLQIFSLGDSNITTYTDYIY